MTLAADDPFWAETAAFVRIMIGPDRAYVAPREFRDVLPTIFPYDWVFGIDPIKQAAGVLIHKGLMHELPLFVLQFLNKEWKAVFANEVFVLFVPAHSPLPSAPGEHFGAFRARLQSLEMLIVQGREARTERTALLVIASHAPTSLDSTLRSLSLLHHPVLVIDARSGGTHEDDYRQVCSEHYACLETPATRLTVLEALKAGVRRLMDDVEVGWISSFDDTMHVRPDFLKIMEHFRDPQACPVLSGFWSADEQIRGSSFRDGFQLVSVDRETGIQLYGHRNYWTPRFRLEHGSKTKNADEARERPFIRWSSGIRVIPGLVTLQTRV
jgi:hypothetical protein